MIIFLVFIFKTSLEASSLIRLRELDGRNSVNRLASFMPYCARAGLGYSFNFKYQVRTGEFWQENFFSPSKPRIHFWPKATLLETGATLGKRFELGSNLPHKELAGDGRVAQAIVTKCHDGDLRRATRGREFVSAPGRAAFLENIRPRASNPP